MARFRLINFRSLAVFLVVLGTMLGPGRELAAEVTHCVFTTDGLKLALAEAETNGDDDFIKVVKGTYLATDSVGGFEYNSSEPYDLIIEGGYDLMTVVCVRLNPIDPASTILDGDGSKRSLLVWNHSNTSGRIQIRYLTLANGYYGGTGSGVGGLSVSGGIGTGEILVEGNIIRNDNSSGSWGGFDLEGAGPIKFINNLVYGNNGLSYSGGRIYATGPSVEVYNNTIVANGLAAGHTGGFALSGSGAECNVDNNIFWGNESTDFLISSLSCDLTNNDIGVLTGTTPASNSNPMSVDPGFVGGANYRLVPFSPLVNGGFVRPGNTNMPEFDLDGMPRIIGSAVDVGAYELDHIFIDGFEGATTGAWSSVAK
jgi:hypothetical protein